MLEGVPVPKAKKPAVKLHVFTLAPNPQGTPCYWNGDSLTFFVRDNMDKETTVRILLDRDELEHVSETIQTELDEDTPIENEEDDD